MAAGPVPGLRPPQIGQDRPDNTQSIVGREGIPVRQDVDGTQIQRLGVAGAEADWGPEQEDITGSETAIADPENVGGTSSSSGIVRSLDDNPFSVLYAWTDENGTIETVQEALDADNCVVQDLGADTEFIIRNVTTKSDNCIVFVKDESQAGEPNNIQFTLNFH